MDVAPARGRGLKHQNRTPEPRPAVARTGRGLKPQAALPDSAVRSPHGAWIETLMLYHQDGFSVARARGRGLKRPAQAEMVISMSPARGRLKLPYAAVILGVVVVTARGVD